MNMKLKIFESNPGIFWMLFIPGAVAAVMIIILFVAAIIYRPSYDASTLKYFDSGFLTRAAQYSRINLIISIFIKILTWIFMTAAFWTVWKYFAKFTHIPVYKAAVYIAIFYITFNLIILPLSFYRGFTIEHQFGLSNQTAGMWFSDFLKDRGIDMVISVTAFTGIYALMVYVPKYWWIISSALAAVFIIIGVYIYPVLIDPLFYRFERLDDREMREEILEITNRAGIELDDILIADASRRTVKANAYFTGFGNTKRIVLYDNLLNNFSEKEVLNVVAHEAAHWKYLHIARSMAVAIAAVFAGFLGMKFLFSKTGITGDLKSIFIIILLVSLFTFITNPVQNILSRHFERQADGMALRLTGEYDAQISLMTGLAEANLSNVKPHPIIRVMLYSHPAIMERIRTAEKQK